MKPVDEMRLHLKAAKLPKWAEEYRFMRERRFRFDFAWPAVKVALEVEGGTWGYGRHNRPQGYERDCEKYSLAAIQGWTVVRVTSDMVRSGRALELVEEALSS